MNVLFVCTGNTCRSPMAAGLLARHAAEQHLPVRTRSAGLMPGSWPATPEAIEAVRSRHVDLRTHRSRKLEASLVREADLVLGMTREHVREITMIEPTAWPMIFTLKEVVRRGTGIGGRVKREPLDAWLGRVAEGRLRSDHMGASSLDDVADPIGGSSDVFEQTARELDHLITRLLSLLYPRG